MLTVTSAARASSDPPLALDHLRPLAQAQQPADGRHLVADDGYGRHRLILNAETRDVPLALSLPFDASIALRLGAASRLVHASGYAGSDFHPTAIQRTRLVRLLAILDARSAGLSKREIAFALVYPSMTPLRGDSWKASSERRRTLRLCDEAVRLRDTGLADLLHGRMHPAG